jgi:hypothetical protein
MTMLTEISQEEYNKTNPILRVIVDDNPRKFGSVVLPNTSSPVVLCWHSDLLQPLFFTNPPATAVWIGIDQRIVCLSSEGNVLFSIGLNSNILQILSFQDFITVLTETEGIAINQEFSIRRIVGLRELPETADLDGDRLVVRFIDGETQAFSI